MIRRQETSAPKAVEQTLLGEARMSMHHHVMGQVLVHLAQTVTQPRTETGSPGNLAARLDVGDRWIMVDGFGKRRVHNAEFFDDSGCVRKQFADPNALVVIVMFGELVFTRTDRQAAFLIRRHSRDSLAVANMIGQLFAEHLTQLRLIVPQIMVAGASTHEEIDDAFRLGRMMQSTFGRTRSRCHQWIAPKQSGHGGSAQPQC